jgi:hypothetical protein
MYVLLIVVCPFVLFLLAIVLSVLLRYTDSDYPFGIFKLFFAISTLFKKIKHLSVTRGRDRIVHLSMQPLRFPLKFEIDFLLVRKGGQVLRLIQERISPASWDKCSSQFFWELSTKHLTASINLLFCLST